MIINCNLYKCAHTFYQKYLNVKGTGSFKESKMLSALLHVNILLELIDLSQDCDTDSELVDDEDMMSYLDEFDEITQCEDCCNEPDTPAPDSITPPTPTLL